MWPFFNSDDDDLDLLALSHRAPGQSSGGSGPIPPLTNLELWLKADAITGLVDNDPVATWIDSSGNSNDATQAVAAARPLYRTNILNGLPIVRFDATDDVLNTPNNTLGVNPFSFFVVYSGQAAGLNSKAVWGLNGDWFMGPLNNTHRAGNGGPLINDGPVVNGVFIFATYIQNGVSANYWVGGAPQGTNAGTNAPGRIGLGDDTAFGGDPLNGDIAEVLGYSADMTSRRTQIEAYLATKYGL